MSTARYPEQKVSSYGLIEVRSQVCTPRTYDDVVACIQYARNIVFKICPAGARLSFSNVCLIDKQISLNMRMLNQLVSLDVEKGEVTVQAGMLTTHLLAVIMPLGYTLVGLTGSLGNTIGGEIGNDVNGKDSWHAGNFGSNVLGLKVATGMGEIIDVDRQHNPEWCNAIIGGMGLTGVILEVRLKLKRIPSFVLRTNTGKCNNITALLSEMNNLDKSKTDFAYCWTDPWAPESSLGRGLI